jgi:ATP-dependent helicase HrpB
MNLPIDELRPEFERRLDESERLVITAETGAGKSTRIPVWLAERLDGLILVVEPRRVACEALAEYLSSTRGGQVGGYFGSRVRFADRSGPDTRVLFCTPGVALRMLAGDSMPGAIVVDEFHERSWQMDLVVAAAVNLERFQTTPLILTSATIDAEAAAAKLGAETLHATGRAFPVDVIYDRSALAPSGDELGPRVGDAIGRAVRDHAGDILVFLPGMKEIRAVESVLGRREEEILIVHGTQAPETMRRVFQSSTRRRIYLSTNVAETSITLPGVRVVIDSGLAKTRLHRAGRAVLATVAISDASMQQRAGRAGRVASGACIRLWSERFKPEPYQRPEIERVELDDFLLQAAELGFGVDDFASATWITTPPEFAVERALERLRSLAAFDAEGLTDRGMRLAGLPVSAEEAGLLVGAPKAIDATLCDLVAILQSRGSFFRDLRDSAPQARDEIHIARVELLAGVADEVSMQLKILRDGVVNTHHLSHRRLTEARSVSRQLRELIGASGESTRDLAAYILTRLPSAGFVRRPRASKGHGRSEPWANGTIEVQLYPYEPVDGEVEPVTTNAAVVLETEWLTASQGILGIGRMVLPTQAKVLAAAGVGESKLTEVALSKSSRGRAKITATRAVQLAGVTLSSAEVELSGDELHRAVAKLIVDRRLFKGTADAVKDALYAWGLLAQWQGDPLGEYSNTEGPDPGEAEAWLAQRLGTLGVESTADLALIDAADFLPDIEAETGIPPWASEPVLRSFPRLWSYDGGTYAFAVAETPRTVQLTPADAKARKLRAPPVRALPRLQGFRVVYVQGDLRSKLR